jgi:sodium/proline symporter
LTLRPNFGLIIKNHQEKQVQVTVSQSVFTFMGMGLFFVVIIFIGAWYTRRANRNPENFFLGARSFGPWVSALSAEASDMSGWLLMGLPGVAYFTGIGEAFWTAVGLALGTLINWQITARRLRVYSEVANNSFTLPSYFSNRFHDKRNILSIIAAVVIIIFFSIYVGSQFVTFGKLFGYVTGSSHYFIYMVLLGALIVFIYTILGGFIGQSMCDFVQSLFMIGAILLVFVFVTHAAGGIGVVAVNLSSFPRFTDLFGIAEPVVKNGVQQVAANGAPLFSAGHNYSILSILSLLAWGLGYFGMPQVLVHFMAIKDVNKLRSARNIGVVWCVISLAAAIAIGLIGRAWQPTLFTTEGESERIFIKMAVNFFPPFIAGLVLSGILGASMSSCDSYMLITSSSIANDLIPGIIRRKLNDKVELWVARAAILLVTLFGIGVALTGSDSIFRIVSYAWAGLGAAFGPVMLFSLFWKRTTGAGAAAGMITGGVMVLLWHNVIAKLGGPFAISELLPAFIVSCLVIWLVSLAGKPSDAIEAEFDEVKRRVKGN